MSSKGKLTTHVLDLSRGCPASGMKLELYHLSDGGAEFVRAWLTNADGRVDQPLLEGDEMQTGGYELVFAAGDYYRAVDRAGLESLIFDLIPIRFYISDCEAHYHIPLLTAPGGYSTYRGS